MYIVLIGIVMGIAFGIYTERNEEIGDKVVMAIMGACIGMFSGFMISIIMGGAILPTEYVLVDESELVALRDNGSVEGNFFLGCGSIDKEFYYFFYKKDATNKITFGKLPVEEVLIIEEHRTDPTIKEYRKKGKYSRWAVTPSSAKYEIYVPMGTIVNQFKLDLK